MKSRPNIKFTLSIFLILLFLPDLDVNAQKNIEVSDSLKTALTTIDSLFKMELFDEVSIMIDSLRKTQNYHNNEFDRLGVDYMHARLLYENQEGEKSIYLLLDGLNDLKENKDSKLYYKYNITLGIIFFKEKNHKKSNVYIKRALSSAEARKDTHDIQESHFLLGLNFERLAEIGPLQSYGKLINIDSSIYHYLKTISHPINDKTQTYISNGYNNLGEIEFGRENYSLSEEYYKKSLSIVKKFTPKDTLRRTTLINNLANLLYQQKKYSQAIEEYKRGFTLIKNSSLKKSLLIKEAFLQNIAWSYNELKNYKLAYEYQEKSLEFLDSLETINRKKDAAIIETKYIEAQRVALEKNKRLKMRAYLLSLIIIILLLCFVAYLIYNRLQNKQQKADQKIERLKYKALNAQMNPHFINNLLICIHDLINKNEKKAAIYNLNKFNTLTNLILQSTKSNLISLNDELHMLRLYLELQQIRFNSSFEYSINTHSITGEKLEHIKVPPLILQPLVENSIVHGFKNMLNRGKINIELIIKNEDYLLCSILDNGRNTPNFSNGSTPSNSGISHKNINERLLLINSNKKLTKTLSFSFLKNKINQVIGTKTELTIPLIYS
tara:strand:+ start:2648 stop:4474 length:1827 start_codon:yes stop_codon:yes gene_type:complete